MKYNFLISDVDGILSDGGHYYNSDGKILKKFGSNDKDALRIIKNKFVNKILFITADKKGYEMSRKRIVDDMGFELILLDENIGRDDFFSKLEGNNVYIGDGIYDAEFFDKFSLSFALKDSTPQAKKKAKFVLDTVAGKNVFSFMLDYLNNENTSNLFENIPNNNLSLRDDDLDRMIDSITELKNYRDRINEFGRNIADCYNDNKKIVFCGVGKNALLSENICEFLQPFNIVSVTLDPHRAVHGNLGILRKEDILILSTKSGNTAELIYMMNCLKKKMDMDNIFLICSNKDAELIKYFKFKDILVLPKYKEIARFAHSPQTTILSYFVVMQTIVNKIIEKKDMTEHDYLLNHQAGEIGKSYY